VGNIYTGSVYMGLISLLEAEREKAAGKKVGIFSYGSGCGAEFFVCQINSEISDIIRNLHFREQLERRKKITFEKYVQTYSKSGEEVIYYPGEAETYKDQFTRFVFMGFKDHRREYL
jgi:hydroxymethylglutaryl-CoA synthase